MTSHRTRDALLQQAVLCRIWHDGQLIATTRPSHAEQLRARIPMPALGTPVWGDFDAAFTQFVHSNAAQARYACLACHTLEKFGQAVQFQEAFWVEFERVAVDPQPVGTMPR